MTPENADELAEVYEIDQAEIAAARDKMMQQISRSAHNWTQSGTLISCTSCPFGHGFAVPPGNELVGIDEKNQPIIKKRW